MVLARLRTGPGSPSASRFIRARWTGPGACTEAQRPMGAPGQRGRTPAKGGSGRRRRQCSPGETVLVGKPPPGVDGVLRWIVRPARIVTGMSTAVNALRTGPRRVVHLELHTGDQVRAGAFYAELLRWRPELVRGGSGCYLALDLGPAVGGGIIECPTRRPLWLPYAEVERIGDATERARRLGAAVLLEPREGRRAGEVSCPARSPGRWPCGSRRDDRRARSAGRGP